MIKVIVKHHGCWSETLKFFPHTVGELLSQNVEDGTVYGYVIFWALGNQGGDNRERLTEALLSHEVINNITFLSSYKKNRAFLVKISAKREKSMSDLIYRLNTPMLKEFFYLGYELWYFMVLAEKISSLREQLEQISTVVDLEVLPIESYFYMFSFLDLGMKEDYDDLLMFAYNNHYFNYPHGVTLDSISNTFKTSRSNISRKMRIIQERIYDLYITKRLVVKELQKIENLSEKS